MGIYILSLRNNSTSFALIVTLQCPCNIKSFDSKTLQRKISMQSLKFKSTTVDIFKVFKRNTGKSLLCFRNMRLVLVLILSDFIYVLLSPIHL